MPYYTKEHCFICYKESKKEAKKDDDNRPQNPRPPLDPNAEICRRFCTLASRYLDLDPYHFHPVKTITTKRSVCVERACDECVQMLASFTSIYEQYEYLRMQLNWRATEISQVMKQADEGEDRKILEEKLKEMGGTDVEEIQDFRSDFINSIEKKTLSFPAMKVERLNMNNNHVDEEEEDPDFIRIPVKKSKVVKKVEAPERNMESRGNDSKRPSSSEKPPVKTILHSSSPPPSVSSDFDSNYSSFTEKESSEENVPIKRPKISLRNAKVNTCNKNVAQEKQKYEKQLSSASITTDNWDKSNACHSSDIKTVINLNGNNNDVDSETSIHFYQHDLLHRAGNGDGDPAWEVEMEVAKSKENCHTTNGLWKQFTNLQYTCPFPGCNQKFNTMTRMVVHQQSTGHNLNAVIMIISKP